MSDEIEYRLKKERFGRPKGTIVMPFTGYDYGLARDDTFATGEYHVTVYEEGSEKFFTIPHHDLERIE